ncbi:hypothetical protein AB9K41_15265 [Cribrihabitans sp. XS_ASV171]
MWLSATGINWAHLETRITAETGRVDFQFSEEHKLKINEAVHSLERGAVPAITIEVAKRTIRRLRAAFQDMSLPDHMLLDADKPWEPSQFLLDMGFAAVAPTFTQAMLATLDDADNGKNVSERLGIFVSRLRIGDCTISAPRPEAIAVFLIREVFEACGLPVKVSHTRSTSSGEGNETLSIFEQFALEIVMPELGTDDAALKVLQRRLHEAERYIR